jgi:pyridoxine 5-phosphate synthase
MAGADGISIQLRRDRKFMRDRDMYLLKELVKSRFCLDIPPVDAMVDKILEVKPSLVTLFADHADADSPASGIDFSNPAVDFSDVAAKIRGIGVGACFLVDPDPASAKGAYKAGADAVLIDCRDYTQARSVEQAQEALDRIDNTAQTAERSGLTVRVGGGLTYQNILALLELGNISEFVVGHAIAVRAMLIGYGQAVAEMKKLVSTPVSVQR